MSRLYLKFPGLEDKENVLEYKREFLASGQKMAGVGGLDRYDDYNDWLDKTNKNLHKENCGPGKVPATLYLSYRLEDNKLIGMLQIRHELNEALMQNGGHIGDSVRPSEQGKGYATEQISLALEKCLEMGIDKVLITCKKENVASAKTIIKNNGKLENEVFVDKEIVQRYWIDLSGKQTANF